MMVYHGLSMFIQSELKQTQVNCIPFASPGLPPAAQL